MQWVAIIYIINTFPSNLVSFKSCSTENCETFFKDFYWLIFQVSFFSALELTFLHSINEKELRKQSYAFNIFVAPVHLQSLIFFLPVDYLMK